MSDIFLGFFFCEFDIVKGPVISYQNIKVTSTTLNFNILTPNQKDKNSENIYKVFEFFKDFLIPRPKLCGMFNSLSYKNFNIISYPTEIRNDNYLRNKIEFNYCLLLQQQNLKNEEDQEQLEMQSTPSLNNFDNYPQGAFFNTETSTKAGDGNHNRPLKTMDWIKELSQKISRFLSTLELKYSLISDPTCREDLFEILNTLFNRIESRRKFSLIYKEDIFSFDFIKAKNERQFAKYIENIQFLKPLLIKNPRILYENRLMHEDYVLYKMIVGDSSTNQSGSLDLSMTCSEVVNKILKIKHIKNDHDTTQGTIKRKCYRMLESLKNKGCILLLDSLAQQNRYLVSSECLKKQEFDLLEEYKEFLEIISIDGTDLNTKKLYNIHASVLKQFFIVLSQEKSIGYFKTVSKIEDVSFIFAFWLFGCYMNYMDRIYIHHKYTTPNKAELQQQKAQMMKTGLSKESGMFQTLSKYLDLFDGSNSKQTVCHSLSIEEIVYDQFVDLMNMRESYHTHKSKMIL